MDALVGTEGQFLRLTPENLLLSLLSIHTSLGTAILDGMMDGSHLLRHAWGAQFDHLPRLRDDALPDVMLTSTASSILATATCASSWTRLTSCAAGTH